MLTEFILVSDFQLPRYRFCPARCCARSLPARFLRPPSPALRRELEGSSAAPPAVVRQGRGIGRNRPSARAQNPFQCRIVAVGSCGFPSSRSATPTRYAPLTIPMVLSGSSQLGIGIHQQLPAGRLGFGGSVPAVVWLLRRYCSCRLLVWPASTAGPAKRLFLPSSHRVPVVAPPSSVWPPRPVPSTRCCAVWRRSGCRGCQAPAGCVLVKRAEWASFKNDDQQICVMLSLSLLR